MLKCSRDILTTGMNVPFDSVSDGELVIFYRAVIKGNMTLSLVQPGMIRNSDTDVTCECT